MDFLSNTFESKTPLIITMISSLLITLIALVLGGIYHKLKSTVQLHGKKLPAGSFGFPVIGESISFLRARKQDKVEEWLEKRVRNYGPLFKTSLLGSKFVVVTGQVGSRFVFQGGDNGLSCQQPKTILKILGNKNIFELSGARHKLIRGGIVGFFKPESIHRFVGEMDSLVQHQLSKLHGKKLPAGSFGFPVIGESISFLRARKQDKVEEWLEKRVRKYGPLFKTSLFGSNVVVVNGQVGSRFVFQGGDNGLSCQQPETIVKILGKKNLFELSGARHKLIRGAIVGFLKPESIQRFVGEMDSLVQHQLLKELDGKDSVQIVKLMKKISFNVAWSIFFGFPDRENKDTEEMLEEVEMMLKGAQAIPVNFPGTLHYDGLKACARLRKKLTQLVEIKKTEVKLGVVETQESIVSWLVNLRDENGEPLEEEEIVDNFVLLIFASHDTIAALTTLFIRHLARDDQAYNKVLQEQMEVIEAKRESENGRVSWKEIQMMKYTWRVAQELMRFHPPNSAFFRQTTRDINFEGFHIPKGWQVLFFPSSTHMENNIFEDPNKFDPSRFENSRQSYPPYTYLAFGAGPRICPGIEFGRIEAMLVIHHFITKYEWNEMIPDEPITHQPVPYPAMGLPVRFHLKNNQGN